jgi:two-component system, LytTR family, response regulator
MTKIAMNDHDYISISSGNNEAEETSLEIHEMEKLFLNNAYQKRKKSRLLVKRGVFNIALLLNDIAAIYTKNKLVYVIDRDSKKYSIDKTLTELAEKLDYTIFFRANRQYIININFVRSFKAYKKVKLLVDIDIPELEEPVIISQYVAPAFKKWMEEA